MELITKALLSAVLRMEVLSIEMSHDNRLKIEHSFEWQFINIYELAHRYKTWAKDNGFVIGTDLDRVNVWSIKDRCIVHDYEVYYEEYTEYTFKACQWIFDEQQKLKLRMQPTKEGD
jgi:hypothetical protein